MHESHHRHSEVSDSLGKFTECYQPRHTYISDVAPRFYRRALNHPDPAKRGCLAITSAFSRKSSNRHETGSHAAREECYTANAVLLPRVINTESFPTFARPSTVNNYHSARKPRRELTAPRNLSIENFRSAPRIISTSRSARNCSVDGNAVLVTSSSPPPTKIEENRESILPKRPATSSTPLVRLSCSSCSPSSTHCANFGTDTDATETDASLRDQTRV